jgi:DNA-binding MarR family transcriptional regulator
VTSATLVQETPKGERSELLFALQEAQHAAVLQLIPEAAARGLGGTSFWSLYWLSRGVHPHPSVLARRLGITAPACTATVDQLVEAGFVQRRPSDEDRRQVVLAVTPKGRRTVDGIWQRLAGRMDVATRGIPSEDLATTARVLRTVAGRLHADEESR